MFPEYYPFHRTTVTPYFRHTVCRYSSTPTVLVLTLLLLRSTLKTWSRTHIDLQRLLNPSFFVSASLGSKIFERDCVMSLSKTLVGLTYPSCWPQVTPTGPFSTIQPCLVVFDLATKSPLRDLEVTRCLSSPVHRGLVRKSIVRTERLFRNPKGLGILTTNEWRREREKNFFPLKMVRTYVMWHLRVKG